MQPIILKGTYNIAKVFAAELEPTARKQIEILLEQPFVEGASIRIMPDVHAGAGCTIGTTMTIKDKVVPNLVGVDIGCGMETIRIKEKSLDLKALDRLIKQRIPAGFATRKTPHRYLEDIDLHKLRCRAGGKNDSKLKLDRARLSLGTLGGGNHFIEVNRDENDHLYVVVHSGSRHLGLQVALHYQAEAAKANPHLPRDLAYVSGKMKEDYLHDMQLIQRFAALNRKAIVDEIVKGMSLTVLESFTTIHNYIDLDMNMLRKGAVSAKKGEKLLIPLNMRDGSLIAVGKGNRDWNQSAPHGAGRIMSRREAKRKLTLADFRKSMSGIYTTTLANDTLDEAPAAYKPKEEILPYISDTVDLVAELKPIYNFKAGGD